MKQKQRRGLPVVLLLSAVTYGVVGVLPHLHTQRPGAALTAEKTAAAAHHGCWLCTLPPGQLALTQELAAGPAPGPGSPLFCPGGASFVAAFAREANGRAPPR